MVNIMLKKILLLTIIFLIIIVRIININVVNKNKYIDLYDRKVNNYVYGYSSPRGRILDRNGKVLVDNIGIKTLFYKKQKNVKQKDELEIAYKLAEIINIKINNNVLKEFWIIKNNNGEELLTNEEKKII